MTELPPAGWYLDPDRPGTQRYWDGAAWTEQRAPLPVAAKKPAKRTELRGPGCLGVLLIIGLIALIGGAIGDLGGDEHPASSSPTPVERNNDQAQREFQICEQQANEIARTQGADAASAHLDQCVDNFANDSQVEP